MELLQDFEIIINKNRVLKAIGCLEGSSTFEEVSDLYERILKNISTMVEPKGAFLFTEKTEAYNSIDALKNCNELVLAVLTLGSSITDKIQQLFDEGNYLEGMLLDIMSDELLFNISKQAYEKIYIKCKDQRVGLTRRLSPGDDHLSMAFQKTIYEDIGAKKVLNLEITEGYMLNPVKSMAFMYGINQDLERRREDHDCAICENTECAFREETPTTLSVKTSSGIKNIVYHPKKNLLEELLENKLILTSPCGGKGTCGKCKVKLLRGQLEVTQVDKRKLTKKEIDNGYRLACQAYPREDCMISIETLSEENSEIITDFIRGTDKFAPSVRLENINFPTNSINQTSASKALMDALGGEYTFSLNALVNLSNIMTLGTRSETICLVIRKYHVIDIIEKEVDIFGVAVDIGTTTIALSLVNLGTGKVVHTQSLLNGQRKYGADIISRIQYSSLGKDHLERLTESVRRDIIQGIKELCQEIKHKQVYEVFISGNTTMHHILMGLQCKSLGEAPFTAITTHSHTYDFNDIFQHPLLDCKATLMPGISAYVGSDIVMGILNSGLSRRKEISLLVDIGTNGEMAIGNNEKIYCLSTAAGPAFEGANITHGIGSIRGAINTIQIQDEQVAYTTIGDIEPLGICGSGVVDMVKECLVHKIIDGTGLMNDKYFQQGHIQVAENKEKEAIVFTQKDIREVQLAKSAIRAGIEVLIDRYGCRYDDITHIYVAGGFGNRMNLESAAIIGLIPIQLVDRVISIGNSSLGGAVDCLLNMNHQQNLVDIVKITECIEITTDQNFNNLFIENLFFHNVKLGN